ncbi:MAG: DNA polymerase III subunit delta [Spirochaetaceae bacterium]|nr:DNA polymerase III subunit delta [Spirochaetaceae bacterium]
MSNRIYLLLGPEKGQKQDRINQIRSQLNKQFREEIEYSKYYAFDDNIDQMYIELNNSSLFSAHSLIVLHNIDSLKSPEAKNIIRYIENPSDSSTLILDSDEFSLKSPLTQVATLLKPQTTIFWGLQENQLFSWVKSFFIQKNLQIDNDAIQYILDQVDNDTFELKIICNQLAFYFEVNNKRTSISENEIESFVHHSKNETAFSLFTTIAQGDLRKSLEIANVILERDNTASFTLIPGLLWSFRRLTSVAYQMNLGISQRDAFAKAAIFTRVNAIRNRKDQATYSTALKLYNYTDCQRIVEQLLEHDMIIRTAGSDLMKIYIEKMIYTIIVNKGKSPIKLQSATLRSELF